MFYGSKDLFSGTLGSPEGFRKVREAERIHFFLITLPRSDFMARRTTPPKKENKEMNRAPGISRTFPGNFPDISWTFPGNFPENSRKFPGNVPDISRKIPGHFPEISRKFPEISRKFPGHFPDIFRTGDCLSKFVLAGESLQFQW